MCISLQSRHRCPDVPERGDSVEQRSEPLFQRQNIRKSRVNRGLGG